MIHQKKTNLFFLIFLSGMILPYLPEPAHALTNVSACGVTLSTANEYYTLNTSIDSSGTCFIMGANNVTLDGAGYWWVNCTNGTANESGVDAGYNSCLLQITHSLT